MKNKPENSRTYISTEASIRDMAVQVKTKKADKEQLALLSKITTEPVKELTPELADKIWKLIQKKQYDDKVSQEAVLHHLKQLKAQMGKKRKQYEPISILYVVISRCMEMVDQKIAKIKAQ